MAADGDYLGEYSRFFAEFVARVNPDDQLPVKVSVYDVNESELVGEIVSVTLQYLSRTYSLEVRKMMKACGVGFRYCPPSLQSYIARLVIQAIRSTCKKQPEICGLRQQEKTYAPLKLMQAITNEVNEICRRYLDNSRLALLPPPSSTPQVTVGAIRNARRKMEDRHMILHDLNTMFNIQDDTIVDYYAVFDGHGGQDAAAYCATHLHQYLVESVYYPTDPERALRDAFLTTDAQFIAKSNTQKLNGGTTAVCALLINKKLYIAWVGDSMASLVTCGNVKQLVNPHRPTREDESERIRNLGGVIVQVMGVFRVNGFLSISRAIGDVPYKPYISGEPEVRCASLDGTEDFLIIACDGLWDYVDQRTAALRVYRQVLQNPYDLKHVHQALLQSAKRAGSLDNITVIVVFLTPPIEIASRSNPLPTHQAPNGLLLNNMDPNNPIPSNHDQFDMKPYIKLIDDDMSRPNFDMDYLKNSMARNGKNRDDDDDEYDYTGPDIGPETDVDGDEDARDPSAESEKSPVEAEKRNDDDRNDNISNVRDDANVCPVDSVVDGGDVDNRVRPSDKDVRDADGETMLCDNGDQDTRVETAGTHTVADDDESPPSPRAAKPLQHALIVADNVADSEDSEDEWDYYRVDPNKQESAAAAVAANEASRKDEEHGAQENPESVVKGSSKIESPEAENDIKCEELVKDTTSPELINIDISDERESSKLEKEQILLDLQEEKRDKEDNMDFQLNPEAAEFVPTVPLSPLLSNRGFLQDIAISGSPLKQTPAMDDIPVPSQSEFDKEVCHRPKEIGEEFSHTDEHADLHNNSSQSMDTSDISSTKAEMGDDESMMHVTSLAWRTNISSQWNEKMGDDAGSDLDEGDLITKNNPMAMSLTPGHFKTAFEKGVDLNVVHMLDDSSDGAEQVNTPPRSPEPHANENRANAVLFEDKIDVLRASTPQPPDENSVSTISSEISSETKVSSLSATVHEKENLSFDHGVPLIMYVPSRGDQFSSHASKVMQGNIPGVDLSEYSSADESQVKDDCSQFKKPTEVYEENIKLIEEEKEEEEEKLCKIEDDKDTFIMKPTALSLQNCSQMIEKESIESEVPTNPDSTNYSNFNDTIHVSKQSHQSLLEETHSETVSDTEQIHFHANFNSEIIPEKMNVFEPFENSQSNQSTNWTDYYKTENPILKVDVDSESAYEDNSRFENKKQEIDEKLHDEDSDVNDEVKPDSTTELNPFISIVEQKSSFAEDELQYENQIHETMFVKCMPTEMMIDKPTEQEQAEKKAAEFAPIDVEIFKEKVASDDIPSKDEKTEPRVTTEASSDDIKTVDDSKDVTGITEASVAAVVAATVADVAIASPIKAKSVTTTSTKRPTKTTTKATTVSTTKTLTKSTPTSPSKLIGATMRATTTTSPAQSIAKRSATSTATRPKQLDGSAKATISNAGSGGKATVTKTTTKTTTTTTATRTSVSPRVSSVTARPKTTTIASSKVNSGATEKKSAMSGDAKSSVSKPTAAKPTGATLRTTTTSTTAKTTLVKASSTAAKTPASGVTLKQRPASATSTAKTTPTSKQSATGVNGASRPKTAPASGGATKPRENTGRTVLTMTAKSPSIDKQSKETVNKQISRSGASAPKASGRVSTPTGTAAGATKTRTPPSSGRSTGTASAAPPARKTLTSRTASRTSSTATKRPSSEAKVLQNGIPKEDVIPKAAVITATSKPEDDDVPRKDASPVDVSTDNQLIAD